MDYFLGSVKLMLIVYVMAAVISMAVAWIIKGIFAGIRMQQSRKNVNAPAAQAGPAPNDGRA